MPHGLDVRIERPGEVHLGRRATRGHRQRTRRARPGQHAMRAYDLLRQLHDVLPMLVGQQLLHAGLGTRLLALHRRREGAQPHQPQRLGFDVQRGKPLAQDRVVDGARLLHEVDEVIRARTRAP